MKLSIVTINKNNLVGLKRTIKSVLQQTVLEVEYILVDGCSSDGSQEFLKKFNDDRIIIMKIIEKDKGIYDAMNKGLNLATGDYVAFLNSGDYLANKFCLETLLNTIDAQDVVYGKVNFFNSLKAVSRIYAPGKFKYWKLFFGWMPPHPMCTFKKKIMLQKNGFDESFRIAADYDLMLQFFLDKNTCSTFVPKVEVMMEMGGVSNGSISSIFKANSEVLKAWKKNFWFIPFWVFLTKPLSKIRQFRF